MFERGTKIKLWQSLTPSAVVLPSHSQIDRKTGKGGGGQCFQEVAVSKESDHCVGFCLFDATLLSVCYGRVSQSYDDVDDEEKDCCSWYHISC